MVETVQKVNSVPAAAPVQPVAWPKPRSMRKAGTVAAPSRAVKKTKRVPKLVWYAKAIFHFSDCPGGVLNCNPRLKGRKKYIDGQEYTEELSLFEEMNAQCKVIKRKLVKRSDEETGVYVPTQRYEPRLWWEILDKFEKKEIIEVPDDDGVL